MGNDEGLEKKLYYVYMHGLCISGIICSKSCNVNKSAAVQYNVKLHLEILDSESFSISTFREIGFYS